MSCQTHCCVFSRGEFYIRKSSSDEEMCDIVCTENSYPYKKLGNISSAIIELQSSVFGRENEFNIADAESRIEFQGADITITLNCVSKENLYRALHSGSLGPETGSIVEDYCIDTLNECDFFKFGKYKATGSSVGVYLRDSFGVLVGALIEGTDYSISPTGIEILRDDIELNSADTLRLSYSFNSQGIFYADLLSKIHGYRSVYFKGTNYDGGGESIFDVDISRVLFAPTNQIELISNGDFMSLTLSGKIEKGNGSWFKIIKQEN